MRSDGDRTVSMFDSDTKLKITKPIRLIELFGGIGSQASAKESRTVRKFAFQSAIMRDQSTKSKVNITTLQDRRGRR